MLDLQTNLEQPSILKTMTLRLLPLVLLTVAFVACSVERVGAPPGYDYSNEPIFTPVKESKATRAWPYPWEQWPLEMDLTGAPLRNIMLLQGDQSLKSGDRARACDFYGRAQGAGLDLATREALILRLASCELAKDQPDRALKLVGDFFKLQRRTADETDLRFSLLMGYAFGRKNDIEQSLAWFSRVYRVSGGRSTMAQSAQNGVSLLLRSVSHEQLADLLDSWQTDSFIRGMVGEERLRRSRAGTNFAMNSKRPFWELDYDRTIPSSDRKFVTPGSAITVGLLLPLSGQYAALGQSTKNGIELALSTEIVAGRIRLVTRDSSSVTDTGLREFSTLVDQEKAQVVMGPILSDLTTAMMPLLDRTPTTVVTFSKRSDLQLVGNGFRIGATVHSQVESLLAATNTVYGFNKYAMIYPSDQSGVEFANAFKETLNQLAMVPVFEASYAAGDITSLSSLAKEFETRQVQAVFIPDAPDKVGVFLSNLSPRARSGMRVLGPALWDNPVAINNSRTVLEGAIFVSAYFDRSTDPLIQQFNKSYQAKFGRAPDFLAAQGFDAATMVLAALRRQREEGVALADALRQVNRYEGLTGRIEVQRNGEIRRQFDVVELKSGQISEVGSSTATASTSVITAPNTAPITAPLTAPHLVDAVQDRGRI